MAHITRSVDGNLPNAGVLLAAALSASREALGRSHGPCDGSGNHRNDAAVPQGEASLGNAGHQNLSFFCGVRARLTAPGRDPPGRHLPGMQDRMVSLRWQVHGGRVGKHADRGWTLWRSFPFTVAVRVRTGTCRLQVVGEQPIAAAADEVLCVGTGIRHRISTSGGCLHDYVHLSYMLPRQADALAHWDLPRIMRGAAGRRAGRCIARCVAEPAPDDLVALATRHQAAWELFLLLVRHGRVLSTPRPTCPPALRQVLAVMEERCGEPLQRDGLARLAGLSSQRFGAVFKATFGLPPLAWLERLRLDRAAALLLEDDRPVAAVAAAVGYADPFHFSRRFRRRHGMSPQALRRHAAG